MQEQDRPRRGGGTLLLGGVLLAAGVLWLLDTLGVDLPLAVVAPVGLVVLGLVVLASALWGGDDGVLGLAIAIGVWVAMLAVLTTVLDVPLGAAVGDREETPTTVAAAAEPHRLLAGQQVLDLRSLDPGAATVAVDASTVLGAIEVIVPGDMTVEVDAAVVAGSITVFGETTDGVRVSTVVARGGTDGRVVLELRVGAGEIVVRTP